ncbi:unnamed protein product, partial [Hapterophycus canaliculatus]
QKYLIFDFPGQQVELFTHCFCVQNVVQRLQKDDVRLAAVHLVDAYHCGRVRCQTTTAVMPAPNNDSMILAFVRILCNILCQKTQTAVQVSSDNVLNVFNARGSFQRRRLCLVMRT